MTSSKKWDIALLASLTLLVVLFIAFKGPNILGDTMSYVKAMNVMNGAQPAAGFIPNRLLTTFGGLEAIKLLAPAFGGNIFSAWFFLNLIFYFSACIVFYRLLARMFDSERTAYLGTIFLAANYGFFLFALHYLMDIGGWTFYIFTLYFLYRYSQSKNAKDIFYAAAMVGIGGLFKEYGFLGAVAIAVFLIIEQRRNLKMLAKRASQTGAIAVIPTVILYLYIYQRFGYTYLDWLGYNSEHYVYSSRIIEYIKSLGSLFNIFAFMVVGGAVVMAKKWRGLSGEMKTFLIAALCSFLPIFFWPAITQRILSITVPFAAIIACFLFKKYERCWYLFLPVLALYIWATFFMDSYILIAVNLPF